MKEGTRCLWWRARGNWGFLRGGRIRMKLMRIVRLGRSGRRLGFLCIRWFEVMRRWKCFGMGRRPILSLLLEGLMIRRNLKLILTKLIMLIGWILKMYPKILAGLSESLNGLGNCRRIWLKLNLEYLWISFCQPIEIRAQKANQRRKKKKSPKILYSILSLIKRNFSQWSVQNDFCNNSSWK